ncbi:hypothetical protein BDR04DRAFT_1163368 [Suillus decipiens]|nr:hypothetical protein BDR04DRAFT_1163368 [Suillus decipiens]
MTCTLTTQTNADTNPLEKIQLLEEEVSKLKIQLQEQQNNGPSLGLSQQPLHHLSQLHPGSTSSSSTLESGSQTTSSVHTPSIPYPKDHITPGHVHNSDPRNNSNSPKFYEVQHKSSTDTILEIIHSGWNPNLPEHSVLEH